MRSRRRAMRRRARTSMSAICAPTPAALPTNATRLVATGGNRPRILRGVQVQVVAEGAGDVDAVELLERHVEAVEEQLPAGVDGALGELQAAHVVLGEDDVAVRPVGDQVLDALVAPAHERVVSLQAPALVDHAGLHEAGEQVDDAGAADADGPAPAMVSMSVASPSGVDRDALDGARHGLHAVLDLVALEGGAGGAARDRDAAVVREGDLGVGADVDGHARPLLGGEARGGDHGQRVRADEPGDGRREVHAAVRVHVDAELTRRAA